jgi:hypothetical protein
MPSRPAVLENRLSNEAKAFAWKASASWYRAQSLDILGFLIPGLDAPTDSLSDLGLGDAPTGPPGKQAQTRLHRGRRDRQGWHPQMDLVAHGNDRKLRPGGNMQRLE